MSEEVLIDIKSTADTKGIDDASKGLDNLSKTGDNADESAKKSATSMKVVGATAAATSGSIQGVAGAINTLTGNLQAMQAALPLIGALMAAFTAWKKVVEALIESQAAQAASLRDITTGNIAATIDSVAQSYNRLKQSINAVNSAQKDILEAERSLAAARRDSELADIELEKQKKLADENDPLKRRQIEAQAAARTASVQGAFGQQDEQLLAKSLLSQRDAAAAQREAADAQLTSLTNMFSRTAKEFSQTTLMQRQAMDKAWTPSGAEKAGARYAKSIEALSASIKELGAQIQSAKAESDVANADYNRAQTAIEINAISSSSRTTQAQATSIAAGAGVVQAQGAIDARAAKATAQAEQLANLEQKLAEKNQEAADLQDHLNQMHAAAIVQKAEYEAAQQALSEAQTANARTARPVRERILAPLQSTAEREEEEARAATAAFSSTKVAIGEMLKTLTAEIKALEREVKTNRLRTSRAGMDVEAGL